MAIRFIGLNKLDGFEKEQVKELSSRHFSKFFRDFSNFDIRLHVKKYRETGKKAKYAINCNVNSPDSVVSVQADNWDLNTAIHRIFRKAQNELEKKFKTEGKPRERKKFSTKF